jgi:ABC-2 type transport system permease protein
MFLRQLAGEFALLAARPSARLGVAAVLVVELVLAALFEFPAVQAMLLRDARRLHWNVDAAFSGLTCASYLLGNAALSAGTFFAALVGANLVGQDAESGTLRTIFSRPVSRLRIYVQKALAALAYAVLLGLVAGLGALAFGLLFRGRGPLLVVILAEGVIGGFSPEEGLARFALAIALLPFTFATIACAAFALSCFKMKPTAAIAATLSVLIFEGVVRRIPGCEFVRPWLVITRLTTWMNSFNQIIPDLLMLRHYFELGALDLALLVTGWLAFRRREFK